MDKTIEVVKAAMEKEKKAKQAEKSMNEKIDNLSEKCKTNDCGDKPREHTDDGSEEGDDMRKLKNTIDGNNDSQKKVSEEETVSEEKAPCDKQAASDKEAVSGEEKDSEDEAASESEEGEASDDDKTSKSFKSIFKSSKNKELEAKEQKIQELTDKLLRIMAEFDNYRKRTEKEKAQMFDLGVKSVIEKILPVVDNFERGLSSISEAEKDSALAQGYNMIYKQLMTLLDDMGVKPIEAVGKPFDPNYHNAVMHSEDENLGENIVAEEFQKGYMYKDMIVRHSMVRVVN